MKCIEILLLQLFLYLCNVVTRKRIIFFHISLGDAVLTTFNFQVNDVIKRDVAAIGFIADRR